ncbi:MAG: 16S rRNA (guanine(527)-N(7))-methyltransferase RsmG [Wenzhouxiangellaceae bacterium]|nr:16S rRNA (guanine(527)-N(7))-methyltransferase RsmG [Wenzhouxiangellaceae bacterium]
MSLDSAIWPAEQRDRIRRRLDRGLAQLGQDLDDRQRERLVAYLAGLARWNRAYNLTAVDDPMEMVDRHIIDSLSVRPFLRGRRILDAGTGAGLPGVVLAIADPGRHFILADGNNKKIRFLRHIRRSLGLDNIEPVRARVESLELDPPPDEIVARALAPLVRLVEWLGPWLDSGARLLAMKGKLEESERTALPGAYNVELVQLEWPGQRGARCLAIVSRGEQEP